MNDQHLYITRTTEALGGKNVSHDAAKKGELSVAF